VRYQLGDDLIRCAWTRSDPACRAEPNDLLASRNVDAWSAGDQTVLSRRLHCQIAAGGIDGRLPFVVGDRVAGHGFNGSG
jgi:hypothetical protein